MRTTQIFSKMKNNIGLLFFVGAVLFKGIGDAIFVKNNPNGPVNYIKYGFLIFAIITFYLQCGKKKKTIFLSEFKTLLLCYALISAISMYFNFCSGKFSFRSIKELLFILVPIIFTYFAFNALKFVEIELVAKISVIIYAISYFLEVGKAFSLSTAIQTIANFSLAGGQSSWRYDSLESSSFPDPMMSLFCFFSYYKEKNFKWQIISFICILLMNKRLIIVASMIILLLTNLPLINSWLHKKKTHTYTWIFFALIFTFSPILMIYLTIPSTEAYIYTTAGVNMQDFWMGRDAMVQELLSQGFQSYGLGSTFDFRQSLLEIESIKFYFETTVLGCAILSFSYWKITRGYIFSIIVMLYIFLNINTSTSLTTGAFAWIYYLFLLGGINYDKRVN